MVVNRPASPPAAWSGEVDLALCNDESCLEVPDVDGVMLFDGADADRAAART